MGEEQPRPGAPNFSRATAPPMGNFAVLQNEVDIVRPHSYSAGAAAAAWFNNFLAA